MKLGYIGLGKMGYNMVELLLEKGHQVIAYNRSAGPVQRIARQGAKPADSVRSLVAALEPPRRQACVRENPPRARRDMRGDE